MDCIYQSVSEAKDIPRAKIQAVDEIQRSVKDLHAVFNERFTNRVLSSLKVELNLPTLATTAVAGATAAVTFGFPLAAGAAAGTIAAAIKFDLTYIRKSHRIPEKLKDYAYLHYVAEEFK
jgi:hypothetical protein